MIEEGLENIKMRGVSIYRADASLPDVKKER